jgi:hypothetical protein
MRLSDAMLAGSMIWTSHRMNNWNMCAIGTAANAVGITAYRNGTVLGLDTRAAGIRDHWPWLWEEFAGSDSTWIELISNLFEGGSEVENLVEFIRKVEPKCDCNRFKCHCHDPLEPAVENSLHPQHAML